MAFRGVVKTLALCAAGLWMASPALAQTAPAPVSTAEPDPGMWAFDGELNGQPGRSLQIDTQLGRTMIVSYLGYRANGSALFLQASGVRGANDTAFTAPLQEFRNGRTIGGGPGNGELAGTLGDIRLAFDTPTTGTVTLPGDVTRRISRYSYGDYYWRDGMEGTVISAPPPYDGSVTPTAYRIQLKGGNLQMNQLTTSQGRLCSYAGAYAVRGALLESEGTATCTEANGTQQRSPYRMERFAVDSLGMFSGTVLQGDRKIHFMGPCLAGAVFTGSPDTCAPFGNRLAVTVQPGMWAIDDEMDGRPGRSLQIDTHNGRTPIIVSYLGYRPDGSSVFMQGSTSERTSGTTERFAMPLREFRNGPVIGGVPGQGGELASDVGEIQLEFDSPTTGTVKLPFETPRRISRFRYEDHAVRFDKTYSASIYPAWRTSGTTASLDIVARNNVFRMDTRSSDWKYCEYRGTYRLAGDGLTSDGTRTCNPHNENGTGTTVEPYSIEQFSVDRNGVLRGSMRVGGDRFLYMGSCGAGYYCSGPGLDLPR